jgi:hypothetical protein
MGMKTDPLARFKAEMPYPHAFSLRHESSSNVPVAGVRDEILTELRCPAVCTENLIRSFRVTESAKLVR